MCVFFQLTFGTVRECLLLMALHLRKGCLSVPLNSLGFRVPLKSPVVLFLRVPFIRAPSFLWEHSVLKHVPTLPIGSIAAPFRDYLIAS